MDKKIIDINEVAELMCIAPQTIYNRIARGKFDILPPFFKLPSSTKLLWRRADVEKWIDMYANAAINQVLNTSPVTTTKPKPIGRPKKQLKLI
jgi:predicted DNA-binding transcriptional regulator AlpA